MAREQGEPIRMPPIQFDEHVGKGQYANTIGITGTNYEVVIDFSFRTATPGPPGAERQGHHFHVARVILTTQAARELRDLLVRNVPNT